MALCAEPDSKRNGRKPLDKLRPLPDQEFMDLIRKVQAEYRLPEKARTIGEMLAEARQQSGAQKLSGHDIMALENQEQGYIKIRSHAKVLSGDLHYDHKDRER